MHNTNGPIILVAEKILGSIPLSYAYLAGYLLQEGVHNVEIMFKPQNMSEYSNFVQEIIKKKPLIVGLGSLYPELFGVAEIIRQLKSIDFDIPVVVGGQMVTPTPEFSVRITGADFGIVGEGEITLYRLVKALINNTDTSNIPGLIIRNEKEIICTGPGLFIKDLKDLPKIPYEKFPFLGWCDIGKNVKKKDEPFCRATDRVVTVHSSRGCPYKCNFCYHHSLPRFRPISIALREAVEAMNRFDVNLLSFSDETALTSSGRVKELLAEMKKLNRPVEFTISSRFDILDKIDDELLLELKKVGCRIMGLGVESGSEKILEIIGKKFTPETVLRGLERLKKVGIYPIVFMMVGQYTETIVDAEKSVLLVKKAVRCNPNIMFAFSIATPFPGTGLYTLLFQKGLIKSDEEFYHKFFQNGEKSPALQSVVNISGMLDNEILQMHKKMNSIYEDEKKKNSGTEC